MLVRESLVTDVGRWLSLGRDVLVRGDEGSGRTLVIDGVCAAATSRGTHVLRIGAFRSPFTPPMAPLLTHDAVTSTLSSPRPSVSDVTAVLKEELSGQRNLVAIDDIDLLDDATLVIVEELLRRTTSQLVATLANSSLDHQGLPVLQMLAHRAPAEVRVDPLDDWEMASLLAARLRGPVDMALTSSILTRSGGNPAVALALADAGRWSSAISRRDGVWVEERSLDAAPHDAIVYALTRQLDVAHLSALRTLAWAGPVSPAEAIELVGDDLLTDLSIRRRVGSATVQSRELTVVAPPALAHGLLTQMSAAHARQADERLRTVLGSGRAQRQRVSGDAMRLEAAGSADGGVVVDPGWATTAAAIVLDATAADRAARKAAWYGDNSVGHASALLDNLSTGDEDIVTEVFELATSRPEDHPEHLTKLIWQYELWNARKDQPTDGSLANRLGYHRTTRTAWDVAQQTLRELEAAIDRGDPAAVLDRLERATPHLPESTVKAQLAAARCDALVLRGNLGTALDSAQSSLAEALRDLDRPAIQIHTASLAGVHLTGGRYSDAWPPIALALRLGPPGPFEPKFCLRSLALGALVKARQGNEHFARILIQDLERREPEPSPLLAAFTTWARAELAYAEGDRQEGDQMLWQHGLDAMAEGHVTAAMVCWSQHAGPYSREQLSTIRSAYDAERLPLFRNLTRLHASLADGPSTAILETIRSLIAVLGPAQSNAVLDRVNELRAGEGEPALTPADLGAASAHVSMLGIHVRRASSDNEPLSEREHQVAILARNGMTNREIASRLFLSVRTVESHMYRALRKLGLPSRAELADWEPGGPPT